ncbi:MAG: ArsR family transcriptional regulator [Saprospiraceae bacterium]
MLDTLISSKTRIKLLLKFFLNSNTTAYLRSLESEFGDSTNAIRLELNKLERAGMLSSHLNGNKKMFRANVGHPLFSEIHSILLKYVGFDRIIENVIERLGDVEKVYVVGEFAKGLDSQIIDLIFIGDIDTAYLINLIDKAEDLVKRKIRYLNYSEQEFKEIDWNKYDPKPLLLWSKTINS